MKFLLDENADRRLAPYLQKLGHDVTIVGEDYPASIKDQDVLAIATKEQRILLTNDRADFGELIFRSHHSHAGVILFRFKLEEANIALKKSRLRIVLTKYRHQLQHFIVLTPQQIRVRKVETQQAA
jgi:predicted nuclease of predicted toxin-antitoxin system